MISLLPRHTIHKKENLLNVLTIQRFNHSFSFFKKEGIFMDKHTVNLLEECSLGCNMAVASLKQLQQSISSTDFRQLAENYIQAHMKLGKEVDAKLAELGRGSKSPSVPTSLFSHTMSEFKLMSKREDSQIAKLILDGCNMGIQTISKAISDNPNASLESVQLADYLIKTEEDLIGEVKVYR